MGNKISSIKRSGQHTVITYWGGQERYEKWLYNDDFSDEQIDFLDKQRESYILQSGEDYFDDDCYERDMWYTMNRSGLFESINWDPGHTRLYITNQ